MMFSRALVLMVSSILLLAGCVAPGGPVEVVGGARAPDASVSRFLDVARVVEPVARDVCLDRQPTAQCDFLIVVDGRRGAPLNAFQTVDRRGRPVLVFTGPLIADFRNTDEMAFVIGHEAAHHIQNHLEDRARAAIAYGSLFEAAATAEGASAAERARAVEIGQFVGSRAYSKQFELEADALGTVIAQRAGFDPVRGAQFFSRLPDPGDAFLGTHPPNAERQRVVRDVAAQLN